MLADAERIHPDLVGQHGLLDEIAQHLRAGQWVAVVVHGDVAEGVQTELHRPIR